MKSILLFGFVAFYFISTSTHPAYELVWSDEFEYTGMPDSSKWSYDIGDSCDMPVGCGWGNHELQYYTDKNTVVQDGHLIIECRKEQIANSDYTSGRIVSKGKGDWKYGKFEIKAKLPPGKGVWSAIWMLPTENVYHTWPASGEIDIMENVGFDPYVVHGTAHTLDYHHSIGTQKSGTATLTDLHEAFHVYGLEWDAEQYTVTVDEKPIFTFKNEHKDFKSWPFDQKFHLILNIAYGGDWGGIMGVDPNLLPAQMVVDYVRVYQKI